MRSDSWLSVMEILDSMPEPSPEVVKQAKKEEGGTHSYGKSSHSLVRYRHEFEIKDFPAHFTWAICPECRIVWDKRLVVFNNQKGTCYPRVITYRGKPADV